MYVPQLGRFASQDPLAAEPTLLYDNNRFGDALDVMRNRYWYTGNNAVNAIDPGGTATVAVGVGIAGAAAGGVTAAGAAAAAAAAVTAAAVCLTPFYFAALGDIAPNGRNLSDKWAHCYVSCAGTKVCGGLLSAAGGVSYEVIQELQKRFQRAFGRRPTTDGFNKQDLDANTTGIGCAGLEACLLGPIGGVVGLPFRQSCDECCLAAYP